MNKKSFTLAEIMIALAIIGIITAILLPVAMQAVPDDNVMKFKKGHATLFKVINELVTSGQYYTPGDLGIKPDGTLIDGTHDGDYEYFCNSLGDLITVKTQDCVKDAGYFIGVVLSENGDWVTCTSPQEVTNEQIEQASKYLDGICKKMQKYSKITLIDDIEIMEEAPNFPFGKLYTTTLRGFGTNKNNSFCYDIFGFDRSYKTFCMDIDGINQGEDPFGYGIRADGKILIGARAQEWLNKSIQNKE